MAELKVKQNQEMLVVLEEEQEKEEKREEEKSGLEGEQLDSLDKQHGIERALAQQKIIQLSK